MFLLVFKKDQRSEQDAAPGHAEKLSTSVAAATTAPMSSTIGAGLVVAAASDYAFDDLATRNQSTCTNSNLFFIVFDNDEQ